MSSPPTRGTSSKSPRAPAPVVQGKHLIIAFLGAIVLAAGIIFWIPISTLRFNGEMSLLLCLLLFSNMIGAITLVPLLVHMFKPRFVTDSHIDDRDTIRDQRLGGWQAESIAKMGGGAVGA